MLKKLILVAICFLTGCSALKGYPGAERPDSETAYIYFSLKPRADGGRLSISDIEVGQYKLRSFDSGIRVLPGQHSIEFNFDYRGRSCASGEPCLPDNTAGICRLTADTLPGRSYRVEVSAVLGAAVNLIDEKEGRPIGSARCDRN